MASFDVEVSGKKYTMEFTRNSIRLFENIGGTITDLKEKAYTSADKLFYVGLNKFHPNISIAEAQTISDNALEEYGLDNVYPELFEKFMEVFTSAGSKPAEKKFILKKA